METSQDSQIVTEQYKNAAHLQTRISIHEKYSVNKQGFGNWIFEQYTLKEHSRILELGCGDGSMWKTHLQDLPNSSSVILTDFSEGMLLTAKANLPQNDHLSFEQVDIQDIPFDDDSFDVVIANMMLYHVPDLGKGLREVKRVLKDGGTFYSATYGEHGITEYIQNLLADYRIKETANPVFTLQNGNDILGRYFHSVQKRLYEDWLEITNAEDFLEYILSLKSMMDVSSISKDELRALLHQQEKDGKIVVPKEYGLFIAKK
jgi:ubiquinone/menaquinone biosynthesis C-methylase UbiE